MSDLNPSFCKRCMVASVLAAAAWVGQASGGAITAGDIVIVRVGDGSSTIGTKAAAVSLLEYTTGGTLVQTINVSSSGSLALTLVGNATAEGQLQLSDNGQYLLLAGYRSNAGSTNPSSSASTTVNRVVGRVAVSSGAVDTSTALTDAYSAVSIRGASSDNGTRFWTSGAAASPSGGLRYVGSLGATTSTLLGSSSNNLQQVSVLGGNLFTSSGAATPGHSVFQVGSGLPTSGSPAFTSSFTPDTNTYQSFYFTNLGSGHNWNGTGFDTVYAVNAGGALFKYAFNGTSWVSNGSISQFGYMDIAGYTQGTSVTLFITYGSGTGVESFTDSTGYNQSVNGTFTSLAGAGGNYSFRGVAYIRGTPEPGAFVLTAGAGLALLGLGLRRQNWPTALLDLVRHIN